MAVASYLIDILGSIPIEAGATYNHDNISADANILWVSEGVSLLRNKRGLRCTISSVMTAAVTPFPNVPTLMEEGMKNAISFNSTSSYTFLNKGVVAYGKMVIVT